MVRNWYLDYKWSKTGILAIFGVLEEKKVFGLEVFDPILLNLAHVKSMTRIFNHAESDQRSKTVYNHQ